MNAATPRPQTPIEAAAAKVARTLAEYRDLVAYLEEIYDQAIIDALCDGRITREQAMAEQQRLGLWEPEGPLP